MQRYALEREVWTAELGWIYMDVNPSFWSGSYFLLESYRAFSASRGVLGDARGAGQATPLARVWVGEYRPAMSLRARVRDGELARYMDVPVPRLPPLAKRPVSTASPRVSAHHANGSKTYKFPSTICGTTLNSSSPSPLMVIFTQC